MKKKILALTILAAMLGGCASGGWQETGVTEEDGVTVKLQKRLEKDATVEQNYSHPAKDIDTALLKRIFQNLEYTERSIFSGRSKKPVFQEQETEKLAPAVATALKRADSDSRVYFASLHYTTDTLLKKRRITEGVIFLDENKKLNIAFSWINQRTDVHGEPLLKDQTASREPLETNDAAKKLVADISHIQKAEIQDGKKAPMWIKADFDDSARTEKTVEPEAAGTEKKEEKISGAEPEKRPEDAEKDGREEVRSRLEYLKGLYEDGLITESEYEEQKQQALEELQQQR